MHVVREARGLRVAYGFPQDLSPLQRSCSLHSMARQLSMTDDVEMAAARGGGSCPSPNDIDPSNAVALRPKAPEWDWSLAQEEALKDVGKPAASSDLRSASWRDSGSHTLFMSLIRLDSSKRAIDVSEQDLC